MEKEKFTWILIGALGTFLILVLILLTYLFKSELIKYSGITTFYSLLFLIFLFILKEYMFENRIKKENINLLKYTKLMAKQIKKNINSYKDEYTQKEIPKSSISYFSRGLPPTINRKDSSILFNNMFLANDKIEFLNEKRDDLIKIEISGNKTKKESYMLKNESDVMNTINQLRDCLEKIEEILSKRWGIH